MQSQSDIIADPAIARTPLVDQLAAILRPLTPFLWFTLGFTAFVYAVSVATDMDHLFAITLYGDAIQASVALSFVFIVLFYIVSLAVVHRERRPLTRIWRGLRDNVFNLRNIIATLIPVIILAPFISAFTSFKSLIGLLNPFHLDPEFAAIDRTVHFGVDPWQITHALVTTADGTFAVNFLYNVWFIVMWGFVLWQVMRLHKPLERQQFLLCFAFCWGILGSLFAFGLSLLGPCYYGFVVEGENSFAPLMARLYEMHEALIVPDGTGFSKDGLWAISVQEALWSMYTNEELKIGAGISAMPSLHVSVATLMACAAWQTNRKFGAIMIAYVGCIVFGSVHLGWHYAIDGYVAIPLTLLLWKLAGRLVAPFAQDPAPTPSAP